MNKVTLQQIIDFNPCYAPSKYLSEGWEGTAMDILNITDCPQEDRLWVVLRNEFFSDKELRLFAVWCARQALAIPGNESEICSNTCDVAERYANGEATKEELAAAMAAMDARAATMAAARASARAAMDARDSAWDSAWATMAAARDSAWAAQIEHLKTILQ